MVGNRGGNGEGSTLLTLINTVVCFARSCSRLFQWSDKTEEPLAEKVPLRHKSFNKLLQTHFTTKTVIHSHFAIKQCNKVSMLPYGLNL